MNDSQQSAAQEGRRQAEAARDRMRRLQVLTAQLLGLVEANDVVLTMVDAGRHALDADAGFAWLLRGDHLELTAYHERDSDRGVKAYQRVALDAGLPICDVVRTAQPRVFENLAALQAAYPKAQRRSDSSAQAWAVIPFTVGGRGIGAMSLSFQAERAFSADDVELLTAIAAHASLALDRCALLAGERSAREQAEHARMRERQLRQLATRLSSALVPAQVAEIVCEETLVVLHALATGAAIRNGSDVRVIGVAGSVDRTVVSSHDGAVPSDLPIVQAIRTGTLIWRASEAELAAHDAAFEAVWRGRNIRSWGAVPFTFDGHAVGALSLSFTEAHELSRDELEFLQAVGQLAAQALERARISETFRTHAEQLQTALASARAATWQVDLHTRRTSRDPSFVQMLGLDARDDEALFSVIHADDRESARGQFERAVRDGAPYQPEVRLMRGDGSPLWVRAHGSLVHGADGKPMMLAGLIVDIDDAKQASLRAEEERWLNTTLDRVGRTFATELDYDRLVQLIRDELAELLGAQSAFVAGDGAAGPLLGDAMTARAPVRIDDAIVDPRCAVAADVEGAPIMRSYLVAPIARRAGELFGTVVFSHPDACHFSQLQERLVGMLASQAATALENAQLYKTVREHKEQLELAIEQARAADRRKDEFLAMLGHELRNPLAAITGALEVMRMRAGEMVQAERDVIARQTHQLTRLIEDLLDVSRITEGKVELERAVVELSTVVARAVEVARPQLAKRGQQLVLDVPDSGLLVDADLARLAQVFHNLIDNAAKFSEPGAPITATARVTGEGIAVEISDQGIGISPELLPLLFDPFVQGPRTLDRSQGGLGIGLTVARRLCELHGGSITAHSAGAGHGATFTVRLPAAVTTAAVAPARLPLALPRAPSRILVVDDNIDAGEMLRELLAGLGHDVAIAYDGGSALELARSFQPDVAVLDIGLPVMDGYELARQLRQSSGRRLQLIAVTGYGQESDRQRAQDVGFDHHLVKPVAIDALLPLLATPSEPE